ncbi:hypothetical protein AtubIFM55763_006596 [Aspergillus tubingensis]|uniref:Protein kinase domain-containing protein n=2 Tax=Aspergillus subgen. Circumdati TaxID=2720871 RepID=A0A100IPV3_ASPNG|nr:hydantoinase B/oxoprolinase family protein [Aspergillus tubingensis]GAQ45144.1 hypothetical protein AKAW_06174 [Aspergillus niger]GFN18362.1 hydantoinase B/oxoprolinase family protein [Aspergillus tubingensis]GLA75325.1 hypothetical protein AtubIFM55763_006596 [Aspergillus tubingensis]GLA79299.1 hypothetical protein AtubIFM56815_000088 [Aspergillus tubingensis]GLA99428.1 hypothetical protein AtubIFM57143_008117 [Aspergillus tubingensis]
MSKELDVNPSEVVFLETLKESKYSVVFKVRFQETLCIMKVYHDREPNELDPPDRIVNLFISESTAYQRLESKGLCQRGVIPNFYGTIRKIQSADWPNLHMFLDDKLPPNAVLIEYIPHLQQIDLSNYTPRRLAKLREILDDIHAAGVLHADPKPRNMMVSVAEEEERVLWIDFDSAQTVSECGDLSPRQRRWFDQEDEMMDYFVYALAKDFEEGKLNRTISYYYEWYV